MPRLPRISGQEAICALERLGFEQVRQKGSHVILKKFTSESTVGCTVPLSQQLAVGTLAGIIRQAQVTPEEFIANI